MANHINPAVLKHLTADELECALRMDHELHGRIVEVIKDLPSIVLANALAGALLALDKNEAIEAAYRVHNLASALGVAG